MYEGISVMFKGQFTLRSPCVTSRNLVRDQEARNWYALLITQTVEDWTVATDLHSNPK